MWGTLKVEIAFRKTLGQSGPRGWFDFIETCLDNAGLNIILETYWTGDISGPTG